LGAAWSPDGRKITFVSDRDGTYEVYVMNADGSGQRRLTHRGS
jgi:TolB protein